MSTTAAAVVLTLLCIAVAATIAVFVLQRNKHMQERECFCPQKHSDISCFRAADVVILLTCTVFIKQDIASMVQRKPADREHTYRTSIRKWLTQTPFRIVVVENSGFDMSAGWLGFDAGIYEQRYESMHFDGEKDEDTSYLRSNTSKGLHELAAINKALTQSRFIVQAPFIVKVTGRFFVPDLYSALKSHDSSFDFNALRQQNGDECQIVGCRPCFAEILFHADADTHVERSYKERLSDESWTQNKVLVLPAMRIPRTLTGGYGNVLDSL